MLRRASSLAFRLPLRPSSSRPASVLSSSWGQSWRTRGASRRLASSSSQQQQGGSRGGQWAQLLAAGGGASLLVMGGAMVVASEGQAPPSLSFNAYKIPIRGKEFPTVVPVFIEVAKGSRMKYEWDSQHGLLRLDRVLHSAVFYPHDYGFIPQTLCDDGDPLDVLVIGDSPLEPGCIVDVRVVGYMVMEDEKGRDEKVLGVLTKDPRFSHVQSLRDLNDHLLREISQFFESYKVLERTKWSKVGGWLGPADTYELVERTHKAYLAAEKEQEDKLKHHPQPKAATAK